MSARALAFITLLSIGSPAAAATQTDASPVPATASAPALAVAGTSTGRLEVPAWAPQDFDGVGVLTARLDWEIRVTAGAPWVKTALRYELADAARIAGEDRPLNEASEAALAELRIDTSSLVIEADIVADGAVVGTLRFGPDTFPVVAQPERLARSVDQQIAWRALVPALSATDAAHLLQQGTTLANARFVHAETLGLERVRDEIAPGATLAMAVRASAPTSDPPLPATLPSARTPAQMTELDIAFAEEADATKRRTLAEQGNAHAARLLAQSAAAAGKDGAACSWALLASVDGSDLELARSHGQLARQRVSRRFKLNAERSHSWWVSSGDSDALDQAAARLEVATNRALSRADSAEAWLAKREAAGDDTRAERLEIAVYRARTWDNHVAHLTIVSAPDGLPGLAAEAWRSRWQGQVLAGLRPAEQAWRDVATQLAAPLPGPRRAALALAWPELEHEAALRVQSLSRHTIPSVAASAPGHPL
jgi:hypothetical protein